LNQAAACAGPQKNRSGNARAAVVNGDRGEAGMRRPRRSRQSARSAAIRRMRCTGGVAVTTSGAKAAGHGKWPGKITEWSGDYLNYMGNAHFNNGK